MKKDCKAVNDVSNNVVASMSTFLGAQATSWPSRVWNPPRIWSRPRLSCKIPICSINDVW